MNEQHIVKSCPMPIWLWHQIETRLNQYNPPANFADWTRRVFYKELKHPPEILGDWPLQIRKK